MKFAGIDIGGANIKLATVDGISTQLAFPIWKEKCRLPDVLCQIAKTLPPDTLVGITMTAELADCFTTRQTGVEFIVQAASKAFSQHHPLFYQTNGSMCCAQTAIRQWRTVAASNWHALARLGFSESEPKSGFVFDIGSTTSDIIPVVNGWPVVGEQDDLQRLGNGQLFYAGVGRTPVCSIISTFQLETGIVTIARELFATMADVFLWLGQPTTGTSAHDAACPDATSIETADGRPATKQFAGQRLARMVCSDLLELGPNQIDEIASQTKQSLIRKLAGSLSQVLGDHQEIPLVFKSFGQGAWLVNEVVEHALVDKQDCLATVVPFSSDARQNQTAPALAVALRRQQNYHSEVTPTDE